MAHIRNWGVVTLSAVILFIVVGLVGSGFYYLWKNVAVADDRARSAKQDRSSPETSRASADAKAGVAADPQTSRAEIEKQLAWAYIKRGAAFHARGEHDRAIADYTQAIEINPKLAQAYAKRGVAYEAIGRREEAIADYRRAVAIDGNEFSKEALKHLGLSQ